jgi:hypothetical protein
MKDFPRKLTPQNIEKFEQYRMNRDTCKFKQTLYEFILSDEFISGKNRGFELLSSGLPKKVIPIIIPSIIKSLKELGWEAELAIHNTHLFIYPPNQKPKILCNTFDEFE